MDVNNCVESRNMDIKSENQLTNGLNSTPKSSSPKAREGKFISQIKKNLAQGKEGEKQPNPSPDSKLKSNKTAESPKPEQGKSTSVFNRLCEPTISSAKKSVKPYDSPKPFSLKGGKSVSGKEGNTAKVSSKENLSIKRPTADKKEHKKDSVSEPCPQGSDLSEDPPKVNSVGSFESKEDVENQNISEDLPPDTASEITQKQDSEGNENHYTEGEKLKEERLKLTTEEKDLSKEKLYSTGEDTLRRANSESTDIENSVQDLANKETLEYLQLKQKFFENQERTFCTLAINNMATAADPTDEQGAPIHRTESIVICDGKVKYINTSHKKVSAKMYDYKCDIKLKVGDQNFKAHRDVLSEASDYFSAMFSHNMKEKEQDVIELKDISPKGFSAMLDYFYHGHVTLESSNVEEVLEGARFFHVDWLLEVCCEFLIQHLSLDNYNAVMEITDKYWLGDLRWDIFRFFGQNLGELTQQANFYENLSLELLLQFLMENIYSEPSEFYLLDVVIKWMKVDEANRKEHLLSLLRQIRFPIMEPDELESMPEEVMQFPEIRDAVQDAMNYSLNIMGQCLKKGEMYEQRGARPVVTVLSFTNEGNILLYRDPAKPGLFIEQLGPAGLETASYQAMSQAKIGNFLYAAGGYDEQYCSVARVFMFDPKYRGWTEVAPMNESRVSFAMCNSENRLFATGGVNHVINEESIESEQVLSSVEMYNPEDNSWTPLQPMPVKSSDQAAVFVDGYLYVTGGISADPDDPVPLNSTWCLRVDGDEGWVPKPNMISGRQGHSMTVCNGKIYAMGGYTAKEDRITFKDQINNEVFDLETSQWTEIAPTPELFGHLLPCTASLMEKIFVMGGFHSSINLYLYDPTNDTWEELDAIGPNVQKLAILEVAYPYS